MPDVAEIVICDVPVGVPALLLAVLPLEQPNIATAQRTSTARCIAEVHRRCLRVAKDSVRIAASAVANSHNVTGESGQMDGLCGSVGRLPCAVVDMVIVTVAPDDPTVTGFWLKVTAVPDG